MVVGFGAGVVPSTTSNARGALLWVFGARGDIGAVTPVGHLKCGAPRLSPSGSRSPRGATHVYQGRGGNARHA